MSLFPTMCSLRSMPAGCEVCSPGPERSTHHANGSDMMFLDSKLLGTTHYTSGTPSKTLTMTWNLQEQWVINPTPQKKQNDLYNMSLFPTMCSLRTMPSGCEVSSAGPERSTHHANGSDMMFLQLKMLKTTTNTNATPSQTSRLYQIITFDYLSLFLR